MTNTENERVYLVEALKACAKRIESDAEVIVGNVDYLKSIDLRISLNPAEAPVINVDKDIYPNFEAIGEICREIRMKQKAKGD